ncbi:MAG: hypothetical protein JNM94_09060 [Phycisphaerae bacterium]|nr:hypothetical protein [Phycisphaerae bacterium]
MLNRLEVPLIRESFCAMQAVVLLGGFLLAHWKARQEVPATWRFEESGLQVTLPGKTLTLPWSSIRACHVDRSIEGYVGMTLEGRTQASSFRRMRCDATEADARIFADCIRELAHQGALDLVDTLRQASSVNSEEIAVRLMRRFLSEDLEIECTVCGAGRPIERAADRCPCGAAGWDPGWTVIPIRDATWSTREEITTSVSSPFLRYLLAPVASRLLARVQPGRTRKEWLRTLGSVIMLTGMIYLVVTAPPQALATDTDGYPWWPLFVVIGIAIIAVSVRSLMAVGRPRALVVEMADRIVVLTTGPGLVVRASDAATFACRRSRTTLVLGGLDKRGEPVLAVSCRARGAVLDDLQRALEARLPIRASARAAAHA